MKTFEATKNAYRYAILGSGKLAQHLRHYFSLLEIPYSTWSRKEDPKVNLNSTVEDCSHILLAVSDRAIADLATRLPTGKKLIHFSGATTIPGISSAHPLMTFPADVRNLEWYQKIPFALCEGETLEETLPGLKNPWFTIQQKDRALYHALVSMSGNFPFILWQKTLLELQKNFDLTNKELIPYLHQVVENFSADPVNGLTGPVARRDLETIDRHLEALKENGPLEQIYCAFLKLYKESTI